MPSSLLYYGDNLDVLRRHVADESVDLIYLDPPFNSNRAFNVIFEEHGTAVTGTAQIRAFEDTWRWDRSAELAYAEIVEGSHSELARMMVSFRGFLGELNMMAYLAMMAPRLVELRRVLRTTGSLYLHCDPTASHYLKLLLDAVFGYQNYRNEIIWKRATTVKGNFGQGSKLWGQATDTLLFYTKSDDYTFNQPFRPYSEEYVDKAYRFVEPGTSRRYRLVSMIGPGGAAKGNPSYEVMGVTRYWRYSKEKMQELIDAELVVQSGPGKVPHRKYYLDEGKGVPIQSLWDDIGNLQASDAERLGYPTQKPEALLERIIQSSSRPGDTVLDPFCGCGTTVAAAERLGRRWIGIDITHLAINLIRTRLRDMAGRNAEFNVIGEPVDLAGAEALAAEDKYQFQWWALGLVGARPVYEKKGADKGIDGRLFFDESGKGKYNQIVLQVKGGKTDVSDVRDLRGVLDREKAAIGAIITFQEPTAPMRKEAASGGFYETPWGKFPRIQLLTVGEILAGKRLEYPAITGSNRTFRRAPRVKEQSHDQIGAFDT